MASNGSSETAEMVLVHIRKGRRLNRSTNAPVAGAKQIGIVKKNTSNPAATFDPLPFRMSTAGMVSIIESPIMLTISAQNAIRKPDIRRSFIMNCKSAVESGANCA
jgi:hypothetical protein